jgi:hypothetical protein
MTLCGECLRLVHGPHVELRIPSVFGEPSIVRVCVPCWPIQRPLFRDGLLGDRYAVVLHGEWAPAVERQ